MNVHRLEFWYIWQEIFLVLRADPTPLKGQTGRSSNPAKWHLLFDEKRVKYHKSDKAEALTEIVWALPDERVTHTATGMFIIQASLPQQSLWKACSK